MGERWRGTARLWKRQVTPSQATPFREAGRQREGPRATGLLLALFSCIRLVKWVPAHSEIPNSCQNNWAPNPRFLPRCFVQSRLLPPGGALCQPALDGFGARTWLWNSWWAGLEAHLGRSSQLWVSGLDTEERPTQSAGRERFWGVCLHMGEQITLKSKL